MVQWPRETAVSADVMTIKACGGWAGGVSTGLSERSGRDIDLKSGSMSDERSRADMREAEQVADSRASQSDLT